MEMNDIKSGELFPQNTDKITESGDNSHVNKKPILSC